MRQYTPTTEVDFVVIGSGAAGGIMAKQLSQAGFSVVVLEQGGWGKYGRDHEYNKDEWLNRNQAQEDRLMSDPTRQRNTFRKSDKEKATPGTHSYGCVVGGGTVTYGGSSWRHLPYEFNELTSDPTIPSGTGMADWPITYEEIEPYYVQAEWEMGMSGLRVNSPFVAPMSKDYPVPPVPLKASGALFNIAAKKMGLTVVPGPLAIITRPYQGRAACVNCGICSGYGCHVRARSSSAVTVLPLAQKTGKCEIRVNSYVREISTDTNGRVTGVIYFDSQKREIQQRAKAVVLSANGTESARLLLLSKSQKFPDGLANANGVVGKYLMLGNGAGASGLFEQPLNEYKGVISGAGIVDFVPSDPKRGFYGGGRTDRPRLRDATQHGPRRAVAGCASLGCRLQEGAQRRSEPQDGDQLLRDADAARDQSRRSGSRRERRVGPAGDAHHFEQPSRRHQEHGVLQAEVDRDPPGRGSDEGLGEPGERQPRRRAQPRQLPHGEQPEDVGGRQVPPRARRPEPVHRGREQPRHGRPQSPDDDDSGVGVSRGGAPD
jgi:choline dehydrogenase-like flavoprotein